MLCYFPSRSLFVFYDRIAPDGRAGGPAQQWLIESRARSFVLSWSLSLDSTRFGLALHCIWSAAGRRFSIAAGAIYIFTARDRIFRFAFLSLIHVSRRQSKSLDHDDRTDCPTDRPSAVVSKCHLVAIVNATHYPLTHSAATSPSATDLDRPRPHNDNNNKKWQCNRLCNTTRVHMLLLGVIKNSDPPLLAWAAE